MKRRFMPFSILVIVLALASTIPVLPAAASNTDDIRRMIVEEAAETDVPASLAMAIAKTGSGFRSDFKGPNGARGVMQILPETAEGMGTTPAALWQPRSNIRLGLEILEHLLQRTEGDWAEALAAYNSALFRPGSAGVKRHVAEVLQWERRYAEQLALQNPVPDSVEARRREVLADNDTVGHDNWLDAPTPPAAEPPASETYTPPVANRWPDAAGNDRVGLIVIERVEERPVIVHAPPPPRWSAQPPRVTWQRAERPRRPARAERRFRRWLRQMAGGRRPRHAR